MSTQLEAAKLLEDLEKMREVVSKATALPMGDRITHSTVIRKTRAFIQAVMADMLKQQRAADEAAERIERTPVVASQPISAIRADKLQLSSKLEEALRTFEQFLEIVQPIVPHEDRTIVSVHPPPEKNQLMHNKFNGNAGTLQVVFSTNNGTYVIARHDAGHLTVMSDKYWQIPGSK